MIAETMEIVRKYNMGEISGDVDHVDRSQRVPASTRLFAVICEIEKANKDRGDQLMAATFELIEWVRRDERKKLRGGA